MNIKTKSNILCILQRDVQACIYCLCKFYCNYGCIKTHYFVFRVQYRILIYNARNANITKMIKLIQVGVCVY